MLHMEACPSIVLLNTMDLLHSVSTMSIVPVLCRYVPIVLFLPKCPLLHVDRLMGFKENGREVAANMPGVLAQEAY